jgi:hypothetical protein
LKDLDRAGTGLDKDLELAILPVWMLGVRESPWPESHSKLAFGGKAILRISTLGDRQRYV